MKKSIAVLSGKGGAGKTLLATNLAVAFSKLKGKTLLIDADFGLPNAHIMLGVNPEKSVENFISGTCTFQEAITKVSDNLSIVPGKSGSSSLVNLSTENGKKIWHGIKSVKSAYEYAIIDNAAGAEDYTMSLSCVESTPLISLIDLPTNFLDAYSTIKIAYHEYNIKTFYICVNQCSSLTDATRVFDKFYKITSNFLNLNMILVGFIPHSREIENSINKRIPFFYNEDRIEHSLIQNIVKTLDTHLKDK